MTIFDRPYQQGNLDCYCGLYCLINAASVARGEKIKKPEARSAIAASLRLIRPRVNPTSALVSGIDPKPLFLAFDKVIAPRFGVKGELPFKSKRKVPLSVFWREVGVFLDASRFHAVVIDFENPYYAHWTVGWRITPQKLYLLDSSGRKYLFRSTATTSPNDSFGRTTRIYASATLFVSPAQD